VNNQLSGYGYDAAGNMTSDPTDNVTASYDAENRIASASTASGTFTYSYDADGNRVEKSGGGSGTLYWYMTPGIVAESDLSGNLKSEYVFFNGERGARKDFNPSTHAATGEFYYFSDHLKPASVITDSSGNIKSESDYYPWGGELQFVNNNSNHYKFTGKERDTESGLDYFGARYYSNAAGRWMSADWSAKPMPIPYAIPTDPQSLNLYGYVRNNPTTLHDKDGHCSAPAVAKGQVGVCIDLYISSKTINVVGLGDGRGPAANDPKATYRVEIKLVLNPATGTVQVVKNDAGTSKTIFGIQGKGTSDTAPINAMTDKNGTTHFSVNNTALNGLHYLPGAPKDTIKTSINMDVTKDGRVGIEGGTRTAYPSLEVYKYTPNGATTTLLQVQEHNPNDLARQDQQIPAVVPK
jgi:RHS repeat-associated protein